MARWLSGRGTERVVLTSRSGAGAPGAARLAAELAEAGTTAAVLVADVAERSDLAALMAAIAAGGPQLRTVVHTAGVVDDGVLDRLDAARLATVLAAKAGGAAVLDELTSDRSWTPLCCSPPRPHLRRRRQGNYAAANAYLDALALHRRGRGCPPPRWPGAPGPAAAWRRQARPPGSGSPAACCARSTRSRRCGCSARRWTTAPVTPC
ncbi:KR domain-containing protein [Streptacidiphilus sp. 4-A2]|nr:KR domain-containing protein [Streptacidiphilus sp. 4-A2]